jgi:hypothetical protein
MRRFATTTLGLTGLAVLAALAGATSASASLQPPPAAMNYNLSYSCAPVTTSGGYAQVHVSGLVTTTVLKAAEEAAPHLRSASDLPAGQDLGGAAPRRWPLEGRSEDLQDGAHREGDAQHRHLPARGPLLTDGRRGRDLPDPLHHTGFHPPAWGPRSPASEAQDLQQDVQLSDESGRCAREPGHRNPWWRLSPGGSRAGSRRRTITRQRFCPWGRERLWQRLKGDPRHRSKQDPPRPAGPRRSRPPVHAGSRPVTWCRNGAG